MVREWSRSETRSLLRVPGPGDDKYSRGVVAIRTGSADYPGAAVLGVEAAWRAGAGYVRYVGTAADAVLARRPETVAGPDIGRTRPGAWVVGSGTDAGRRTAEEERALREILAGDVPVVVDAGALDLAPGAAAPLILTPHAGEFRRLCERIRADADLDRDREGAVAAIAARLGQTVLLKGSRTLVADPDGEVLGVGDAPGWLAAAGTGDVLAGVIAALAAANPGRAPAEVAASAAWLHGHAARLASGARDGASGHPIVALDVAEALPRAIADLLS
ncbi:NAD(P)H-hydrate dehydratase [Microbacterium sp. EF45047]|uniref:NAD(P)H-hydrate dehydratase n=1 Tax=Microbacterium sp. EF45047 TaxID=2809708 RepID=UPI00234B7120|nr:NAD(P)H-hydrate dehydratase [Microbacterium sp. EF45047]WCM56411.1 NAD(P)H-hydrate dehydratase [Microbacterium sp. EF45047]